MLSPPAGLSFGSQAFLPFPLWGWGHMAWGPHGLKLLGSGGGNFGDSNLKSTFQKVKNNTWKIRKCPVFYVDRRAKCRKRSPQKWTPLPWHHGNVGLASMPPSPPYSEPGKTQSSGVLCPLWTLWLIILHHHYTSIIPHENVSFLKFYYFVDWEIFYYKPFHLRFKTSFTALQLHSFTAQPQATSNFSIEKEGCISTAILPKWYC